MLFVAKTKEPVKGGIGMKGNSDKQPEVLVKSNGKTQVRYDIKEVIRVEPNQKDRTSYDFEYVEIEGGLTRGKIINAVIENVYSKDAELALINNELATPGTEDYKNYQLFRIHAKEIADKVLK